MTRDLFRRYVWLVDTVKSRGPVSFDEISKAWSKSAFNVDRSKLALRTFHNHREAIEQLFGIPILCDRRTYLYFLPQDQMETINLKLWMLQMLAFNPLMRKEGEDVRDRMITYEVPCQKFGIISLISCMKKNISLKFRYPSADERGERDVEADPYALRFYGNMWMLWAKDHSDGEMRMFRLPYISELEPGGKPFEIPAHFAASDFFGRFIGADLHTASEKEKILLKVKGIRRNEMERLPLHPSQRVVESYPEFTLFELDGAPTADFIGKLLAEGESVEVMAPESLRHELRRRIEALARLY